MIGLWPVGVPLYMLLRFRRNRAGLHMLIRAEEYQVAADQLRRASDGRALQATVDEAEAEFEVMTEKGLGLLKDRKWIEDRLKEHAKPFLEEAPASAAAEAAAATVTSAPASMPEHPTSEASPLPRVDDSAPHSGTKCVPFTTTRSSSRASRCWSG